MTDAEQPTNDESTPAPQSETAQTVPAAFVRRLRNARRLNVVLGALALFLAVVVAAQQFGGGLGVQAGASATEGAAPRPAAQGGPTLAEQVSRADAADPMALGPLDAPLTIIEWTDYRCPFCASFTNSTLPAIVQEYVDAGHVRYEVRDVAFFGDESLAAAIAGRAAAAQDRFFEYMTVLYAAAPASGHPDMPREKLVDFAAQAGVPDLARFEADLDDPALAQAAAESTTTAQQMGVNSVPFFLIGDTTVGGAQPIDAFRQAIDAALETAAQN